MLRQALASDVNLSERKWKGEGLTLTKIQARIERQIGMLGDPVRKTHYRKLLEKLQDCVKETVRLYYE